MSEIVEGVVKIISSMSKRDKEELLECLLSDKIISEDLADALTVIQRRDEKAIPWETVEPRMRRSYASK